jgi:hypothetical protein
MSDDHWQGMGMSRADMGEMNIQPVVLGDELQQRIQPGLTLRQSCSVCQ